MKAHPAELRGGHATSEEQPRPGDLIVSKTGRLYRVTKHGWEREAYEGLSEQERLQVDAVEHRIRTGEPLKSPAAPQERRDGPQTY